MRPLFLALFLFLAPRGTALCEPVRIVTMDFPPYAYEEKGRLEGFNIDLLKEIFRRMEMRVDIKLYPWARAVFMVKKGTADAIFPFLKTEKREAFTDYSDVFTTEEMALFVLRDSPLRWHGSLNDLASYTFGRVRGYRSGPIFDSLVAGGAIRLEVVDSTIHNIKMLLGGRFDIMGENRHVALHELKKLNRSGHVRMLSVIQENPAFLGFSKKRNLRPVIAEFNKVLKGMRKDGTYRKIIDDFFLRR